MTSPTRKIINNIDRIFKEDPIAESFFHTLKVELIHGKI